MYSQLDVDADVFTAWCTCWCIHSLTQMLM